MPEVPPSRAARSPAIPDQSDRRPRPIWPETAAIVAAAAEAGGRNSASRHPSRSTEEPGQYTSGAVGAREPAHCVLMLVERNAVTQRLAIAGQEAVTCQTGLAAFELAQRS